METLIGAGILLVGVVVGVVLHAWAWGGRFTRRAQAPPKADAHLAALREAAAEQRRLAEWNRQWIDGGYEPPRPEPMGGNPVGTVPFDPRDLRGKGSFQP